jgi:hypothetical protein
VKHQTWPCEWGYARSILAARRFTKKQLARLRSAPTATYRKRFHEIAMPDPLLGKYGHVVIAPTQCSGERCS